MTAVDDFIEEHLAHYADQYYDPAKAHDYYLRTRQLKGRQSTKGMSAQQKEAWAYAKNQIGNAKKADEKAAAEASKQFAKQLRDSAKAKRDAVTNQLNALIKSLAQQSVPGTRALANGNDRATENKNARARASVDRAALSADLKAALDKARSDYAAKRDALKAQYDAATQKEYDAIRKRV